jgi:hypothetical protein
MSAGHQLLVNENQFKEEEMAEQRSKWVHCDGQTS